MKKEKRKIGQYERDTAAGGGEPARHAAAAAAAAAAAGGAPARLRLIRAS